MGTPVPFGSVLKSLFLCDIWNFCHHSSEKGGQERLEQQTFSGEERVKTDSYHAEFGCWRDRKRLYIYKIIGYIPISKLNMRMGTNK